MSGYIDMDQYDPTSIHKKHLKPEIVILDLKITETPSRMGDVKAISYADLLLIIDWYAQGEISFGKAVELSKLGTIGFLNELKKRGIKIKTDIDSIDAELDIISQL